MQNLVKPNQRIYNIVSKFEERTEVKHFLDYLEGLAHNSGFESSQIFNLHIFASGIFGYLLNGKTTCIFDNFIFMNENSEISCCFKGIGKSTLNSLRLQLYKGWKIREWSFRLCNILCCFKEFCNFQGVTQIHFL